MNPKRSETPQKDKWNVEAMFASLEEWDTLFKEVANEGQEPRWPDLADLRGHLGDSPATLRSAFDLTCSYDRKIGKLYVYARQRHDEDTADDKLKELMNRALVLYHDFQHAISWLEPEIIGLPQETLDTYLASDELADYRFHLEKLLRMKEHTLSPDKEALIAQAGHAFSTAAKGFRSMNDADFHFGEVIDGEGKSHVLTHGSYAVMLRSSDRTLRKNAFHAMLGKYGQFQNTFAELLAGQAQVHLFNVRSRGFDSCVEAALKPKNIDVSVYRALIDAVREGLPALHRYTRMRKEHLGLDELHLYDMYVPLVPEYDRKVDYAEAEKWIVESVAPLGEEYQDKLRKGLVEERWVDRYENENKRSGAYSSGCYDSMPYILMNYNGTFRDVFTLAHEAGHSMHSLYSKTHQPYHYYQYSIFVAEVASTFNEDLLHRYLMERAEDPTERRFLISQRLEDIRATLFRQAMFAEFELRMHELLEQGVPLTPSRMQEIHKQLNLDYFGPDVVCDNDILWEWSRIPHFYYNFYVYQYATGISAALALAERVVNGGDKERDDYLGFLKAGCSTYPTDTLKHAGVDMCSPEPVKTAIQTFDRLIDAFSAEASPVG